MILDSVIFFISLLVLLWSADQLVNSAVLIARRFNISTMAIGLTVVSIGTSLPELSSSVIAAYSGYPTIALGNVIGSNICNIALILALPACFVAIHTSSKTLRREGMLMLIATLVFWIIAEIYLQITFIVGIFFLISFIVFIFLVLKDSKAITGETSKLSQEIAAASRVSPYYLPPIFKFAIALVVLLVSSHYLVQATVGIAQYLDVSESIIALTLIAFGTSVPELSVTFSAARKNEGDILVGNILGSNISNILLVIGLSALFTPLYIEPQMLMFDFPAMLFIAILMVYFLFGKNGINRPRAVILLAFYSGVILRTFLATYNMQ